MSTSRRDVFLSTTTSIAGSADSSSAGFPFLIRAARHSDLNQLTDLLADSFHTQEGVMAWVYPILHRGIYEDLRSRLRSRSPHQVCLVALKQPLNSSSKVAESLVGTVEVGIRNHLFWQSRTSRYLYISNLAVQTDYRQQGVASRLLSVCERVALSWGYQDLYLHVLENNDQAKRLYQKAGYKVQRVESNLGSLLLGQPQQLFLHKHLSPPPSDASHPCLNYPLH